MDTVSLKDVEELLKLIYAGNIPYLVLNSTTKTSVLLFYFRLFGTLGTRPGFRKLLFATQTLVVLWFVGSILPGIFRCHPIHDSWNPKLLGEPDVRHDCINDNTYYFSSSVLNVALDLWILLLPISIIWTLQLSARRKVGLSAIFLLGGFLCGASIGRAYTIANVSLSDFSYDTAPSAVWSSVEISFGIICACLPTIPPVFQFCSRRVRNATSQRRTTLESNAVWYSESTATRGRQNERRYLDEELTTLRPAYSNSKGPSERSGIRYGAEAIDDNEGVPVAMRRSNQPSGW
ncbi:hypothetical protein IMSHALPRED_007103 [Imshaugia aleurites]|uniref:Rhodopsin domain-containing protein n=1 Tax=Imshaugia aleurites TaxID=172621 RepID=A0A8H3FNG8_9LECA|nr:hypothetical protein IMSHALPRED_007103 [Imshaugia aleurites]